MMPTESGVSQEGVRHGMEYAEAEIERLEARVRELEAALEIERNTRIVQESNHDEDQYEDEAAATDPERDLAEQTLEKLEWLVGKSKTIGARKEWYDKGRQWLAVTWDGGQYAYFTRDGERTRAEALALLKGAKDGPSIS